MPPETTSDSFSNNDRHFIVGVGASAGGLQALREMLSQIPEDSGMAFVLIMHLDPDHKSMIADLIGKSCRLPSIEASDGIKVEPNQVYTIAPNTVMTINDGVLNLKKPAEKHGLRMPIDRFLESLAEDTGEDAIGVILSGTGTDGTLGVRAIKAAGGLVMVQSPQEATYDGMPRSAISTGDVDYIVETLKMADKLNEYRRFLTRGNTEFSDESENSRVVDKILALINARTGKDFRAYKRDTILRRVQRRISIKQLASFHDYHLMLQKKDDEVSALVDDLLIGVTSFFRDSAAWVELLEKVLIPLVKSHSAGETIRVWVPGCSTGEEAYTIAILLNEAITQQNQQNSYTIFATDVNTRALEIGRRGSYPESMVSTIDKAYLDHYFDHEGDQYIVKRPLRERMTFAEQDVMRDPPFSKLHLLSCRNFLIYIDSAQQDRIISLFHFALKDSGYLFLGSSESIGSSDSGSRLFSSVVRKFRIYQKVNFEPSTQVNLGSTLRQLYPTIIKEKPHSPIRGYGNTARQALLEEFTPAAVLINESARVLYFHGDIGNFLDLPRGEPTDDLYSLAGEYLRGKLRSAIFDAAKTSKTIRISGARVKRGQDWFLIDAAVIPRHLPEHDEKIFLVAFRDRHIFEFNDEEPEIHLERGSIREKLEEDLMETREELRLTMEQMEASNEEMKAANEEVMSMNEELQSTNEELETSKEELQSLNEELTTLNTQLEEKVLELEEAHSDIRNFFFSTRIPTIFLDKELKIRRFTPTISSLITILPSDINRPISDLTWSFDDPELLNDAKLVLSNIEIAHTEIKSKDAHWYQRKIMPYRSEDNQTQGVVILFYDITHHKRLDIALRTSENNMRRITNALPALISYVDKEYCYRFNNTVYADWFDVNAESLQGMRIEDVVGEEAFHEIKGYLDQALSGEKVHYENWVNYKRGGRRYVSADYIPDKKEQGQTAGIFILVSDMTERKRMEDEVSNLSHIVNQQINDLNALLDAAPIGIYVGHDKDCHDMTMNRAGKELLRLDEDINPSKTGPDKDKLSFKIFHQGKQLKPAELPMQQAAHLGENINGFEETIKFSDGEEINVITYAAPLKNEKGEVRGCVGTFADITGLRILEAESVNLSVLLKWFGGVPPIALIEWNHKNKITFWNEGAEKLFGWTSEETLKKSLNLFLAEVDENSDIEFQQKMVSLNQKNKSEINCCMIQTSKRYQEGEKFLKGAILFKLHSAH